jgi:hypothetical protein
MNCRKFEENQEKDNGEDTQKDIAEALFFFC